MSQKRKFAGIILAAGKGTRMGGDLPKVLHEIKGRPMISHVIDAARKSECSDLIVVVGYKAELVEETVSANYKVSFAFQAEQLGTGHAVKCALPYLKKDISDVLILFGDVPLISHGTLLSLINRHIQENNDITMLTAILEDPKGYGRIVTCSNGNFVRIVEEKDADHVEKAIKEINTGICCVSKDFLEDALGRIGRDNAQNEFYFTDIIEIGNEDNRRIGRYPSDDPLETSGVNTREQLNDLETYLN